MANQYFRVKLNEISDKNVEIIIKLLQQNPDKNYYINVKNTKYINEDCLYRLLEYPNIDIRIEGGYDQDRIINYTSPEQLRIHKYDNIYSISEVIRILREIKSIESGINYKWSQEHKLIYFISFLQDRMVYYLDEKTYPSKVVRSLRGLYTRKTVCAGYSLILKELCDRNGIECDYVEGSTNRKKVDQGLLSHAWNIVKINNNYFPVDLTFNANNYIRGEDAYINYLCNAPKFIINHVPGKHEKLQDYENNLKSMDSSFIRKVLKDINQNKFFDSTKFYRSRKDGSRYLLFQLDSTLIGDYKVYKYVYCDLLTKNRLGIPIILYSSTNISDLLYKIAKESTYNRLEILIDELLFSKNNILQAIKKRNGYIGGILFDSKIDDCKVIVEINLSKLLNNKKFKTFRRKDGSYLTVEMLDNSLKEVNNHIVYCYNIYEYFYEEDNIKLKLNKVYTDFDLFLLKDKGFVDTYLERKRIDDRVKNYGGYLGYYSKKGKNNDGSEKEEQFCLSNKVDVFNYSVIDLHKALSFQDLKELVYTYKVICDDNDRFYVFDRKNGKLIDNEELCIKVRFANLWVCATSDEKLMDSEVVETIFSEFNEKLFVNLSSAIDSFLCETGNIDTIGVLIYLNYLYRNFNSDKVFEVVTRLFSTNETNDIINRYFRLINPSAIEQTKDMDTLIDVNTAKKKVNIYKKRMSADKKDLLEVKRNMFGTVIKEYKH